MNFNQPKPASKNYKDLIHEIESGVIKIPKFQRDFVWSLEKTAGLLDSILKGYPIGTFILWQTSERLNDIKNIGNVDLPDTSDGTKIQYVLDGQQRLTSLFAAFKGIHIQKANEKKVTNYHDIYVNLNTDEQNDDEQIVTTEYSEAYISLYDVLNFSYEKAKALESKFSREQMDSISNFQRRFETYEFSTVVLRKEDLNSAIEVFTRINTGGKTLTLFEIMSAKTYDEKLEFDMQKKWQAFIKKLETRKYEGIYNMIILHLLSVIISSTKECRRRTILSLEKDAVINKWDECISAIEESIDFLKTVFRIPVSQILPYDSLITIFAYFFYKNKEMPNASQRKYLEELFYRASLSQRYSSGAEGKIAKDIKRVDQIIQNERPDYSEFKADYSTETLINTNFRAGNSYCKAILCILCYQEPKDFENNGKVILDNSWLKIANSKNYHHFFPKSFLKKRNIPNENSIVNITFVSDHLNKRKIGANAPAEYIEEFQIQNDDMEESLKSHLISLKDFGIESNDYETFLRKRSQILHEELATRIELQKDTKEITEIEAIILKGESDSIEFKSTLRYDIVHNTINKKLEFVIAKTISAFLNRSGGNLIIGVDDEQNILGLEHDINSLPKKNIDGFELKLLEIIKNYIGADLSSHIKIEFPRVNNVVICWIKISESSKPVFIKHENKEDFFIRSGCSSIPLSREEQSSYEKSHWV